MTTRSELFQVAALARRSLGPAMPRDDDGSVQSAGTCLYASIVLLLLLRRFHAGMGVGKLRGGETGARDAAGAWHGHYWVEVECGDSRFVVDATADQFGYEPIVVLRHDEATDRYRPGPQAEVDVALAIAMEGLNCADLLAT